MTISTWTRMAAIAAIGAAISVSVSAADSADMFLREAIQGNLAEISMGELAQKNGSSDAVKDFGRMLVADHSKGRDDSTAVAKKMNVEVPTMPTAEQKAMHDKMMKMTGAEFDREFASHMVMDHEKDIKSYQDAAKAHAGNDAGKYAANTLPVLQKHLKTAQSLKK